MTGDNRCVQCLDPDWVSNVLFLSGFSCSLAPVTVHVLLISENQSTCDSYILNLLFGLSPVPVPLCPQRLCVVTVFSQLSFALGEGSTLCSTVELFATCYLFLRVLLTPLLLSSTLMSCSHVICATRPLQLLLSQ